MKTIYKYKLSVEDTQEVDVPRGSHILSLDTQRDDACVWFLIPNTEIDGKDKFIFRHFGTGQPLPLDINEYTYLGTYLIFHGELVYHVFYTRRTIC
jgi:hypothetical protein